MDCLVRRSYWDVVNHYRHIRTDSLLPVEPDAKDARFDSKPFTLENKAEWYGGDDSDTEENDAVHHDLASHYGVMGGKGCVTVVRRLSAQACGSIRRYHVSNICIPGYTG